MVDNKYSTDDCMSPDLQKLVLEQMLKFVSDHFKTKNMCKSAVKKLSFVIRHVPG